MDGSGQEISVVEAPGPVHISDVSADGRYLLFEKSYEHIPTTTMLLEMTPGAKPRPLTDGPISTHFGRFSPDSKWVVYVTAETGRNELYATSVLQGGKEQLTSTGAVLSRWAGDQKAIYFSTGQGATFALPITVTSNSVKPGNPKPLFSTSALVPMGFYDTSWDATPNGRRFLLNVSGEWAEQSRAVLITNWPARLKK